MKLTKLREKNIKELNFELISLLREQFNLRMQVLGKKSKQTHDIKYVRRNIARVKTLLTEKRALNEQ